MFLSARSRQSFPTNTRIRGASIATPPRPSRYRRHDAGGYLRLWINSRLYQYSDPDMMKFSVGTAKRESKSADQLCGSRNSVFLNSDDLGSPQDKTWRELFDQCEQSTSRTRRSFLPTGGGNTARMPPEIIVRRPGNGVYGRIQLHCLHDQ